MTDPRAFVAKIWKLQGIPGSTRHLARKNWDAGPDEEDWEEIALPNGRSVPDMTSEPDWYFAPCLFSGMRRQSSALPSRLLYADLDEVDPHSIDDVPPSIAWETSPGSYQGIWILDRQLGVWRKDNRPGPFEDLNRKLTYYVKADKGGWSSTKVLRPPGTRSTKYGKSRAKRFTVRLLYINGPRYKVEDLMALLKHQTTGIKVDDRQWGNLPDFDSVLREHKHKFPTRVRQLLRATKPVPGDDRSARLWELHNLLLQCGLTPEEVLVVARSSSWNKYRGQHRELHRLKTEIAKAVETRQGQVVERGELDRIKKSTIANGAKKNGKLSDKLMQAFTSRQESVGLGYLTFNEFLEAQFPKPQWLVEGFWTLGSYGVWAGEFKSFKTITLLDFALSVASGVPFLGKFKVHKRGTVAYAHDEGTPGLIQDRLWRIGARKGLVGGNNGFQVEFGPDLPLHVASWPKLNLTEPESQERLKNYCAAVKPEVIILESFYLMAQDIDENSAHQVTPALAFLKELSHQNEASVIVSHHYNKGGDEDKPKRPGLRMSGSTVFGRWYESAVYLERKGDDIDGAATISAEHREQKGTGRMNLKVEMDMEDEYHYRAEIVDKDMEIEEVNGSQGGGSYNEQKLSAKQFPCPICKARVGQACKDPSTGERRGLHPSRKKLVGTA